MHYRYLGNSGFKIGEITFGNWLTHASQIANEAAIKTVHRALELGITSFDTSDNYANTKAEEVLGEALKGQRRESLEILTKVYFPTGPGGANDTGLSRKHIFESLHGSLRRLGTDYVDVYQCHRFDYETPLEETFSAFSDLTRQGKIFYVGVSEFTAEQLIEAHGVAQQFGVQLVSNQPQYSALWRVIEDKVVPTSQGLGVSQIVFSPMAQGVLTGKYVPGQQAPADSRAADEKSNMFIGKFMDDTTLERVQLLKPIAADNGLTVAQLSLAWVLQNRNIASVIVGASRPEQLDETVQAAGVTLDDATMRAIDEALGDSVERDAGLTYNVAPKTRLV